MEKWSQKAKIFFYTRRFPISRAEISVEEISDPFNHSEIRITPTINTQARTLESVNTAVLLKEYGKVIYTI